MPGDLGGVVACEVAHVERGPQRLLGAGQGRVQREMLARLLLASLDLGVGTGVRAAQRAKRQPVQVLEQLALPGVPHLGAGAADVGHREEVERGEPTRRAHEPGEGTDHFRVRQVFLLGDAAHRQMLAHQEFHQPRVFQPDAVRPAEAARLVGPELGMVAATALGDVVEQRRDVKDPRGVELRGQL